jgi:AraC family transcriptional regulator
MQHQIIEKDNVILAGMTFYGDPFRDTEGWSEENKIGRLWNRFNAFWDKGGEWLKHVVDPSVGYEVHIEPEDYAETKEFYVMVGVQVEAVDTLPLELSLKVLPSTTYAVFTLKGSEITSNWPDKIYKEWLPNSAYEEAHKFTVERYGPTFKGMDNPESELEVWVPIRPKTDVVG